MSTAFRLEEGQVVADLQRLHAGDTERKGLRQLPHRADAAILPVLLCQDVLVRRRQKGSKERVLPLANDLATILRNLLEERRLAAHVDAPLFVDARGNRLTRFGVTHDVRRSVSRATKDGATLGRGPISPQSFRHYLPFLTMSRPTMPAAFFRHTREAVAT